MAAALRDYRGQVAIVFQDSRAHINPVRSIGDFMTEALRTNRDVSKEEARRRAVAGLADVGIEDGERRLRQYPHELSGGLLQRVMIAAALLTEPKLLLADEPTTALDVTTQAEVMAILDDLRREHGLALLFITHDLDLADAVCDRTCVMYAGQIVEQQSVGHAERGAAASLHRLAVGRPPVDRRARRPTGGHSRAAGVGLRGPRRVRVCAALHLRPGAVHRRAAAAAPARGRQRALRARRGTAPSCSPRGCRQSTDVSAEPILQATGLRKEYGPVVAVDDLELTFRRAARWRSSASRARARRPSPG